MHACVSLLAFEIVMVCRYGGLWKNLHKADKVPDHPQGSDIQAEQLHDLEATQQKASS